MADLSLQPSIAIDLRSQSLLELIERLQDPSLGGTLDLSTILVYRMGSLVNSATIPMAWQFDVLNPLLLPIVNNLSDLPNPPFTQNLLNELNNLNLNNLYDRYRALILLSTPIHSIMGTPAAINSAMAILGVPQAVLQEGQNSWGGNQYPSSEGWAVFRITLDIRTLAPNTNIAALNSSIVALANFWKPARCILDSVQFTFGISETLIPPITDFLVSAFGQNEFVLPLPSDVINAPFAAISETKTIVPFYNGRYYFSSSVTYGATPQPAVAEGPLVINGTAIAH